MARKLYAAAVCGLMLAAASPSGVHGLSDSSSPLSDTLRVTLSAPAGGTVAEGATGHFEVSVAGSTAAGAVKVQYSVSGTAVAGEDYTALSGEATVAQGEGVARIALEALKDDILDKGETVVLALTGATGPGTVLVDQTAATATIADNGTVEISLAAVPDTIGEGSSWRSTMTMSTPVADRVSVRWWTTDGTAVAGRDYVAADEVVSFQPGETSKPISVQTLEDDDAEAVEVFYVTLGLPYSSARTETEEAIHVDPKPQSAFIQCSVAFPPNVKTMFRLNEPVPAGTVIGTVAADTHSLAVYSLSGGGNRFKINELTAEVSTTAILYGGSYHPTVSVLDDCGDSASVNLTIVVNSEPEIESAIPDATVNKGESGSVDASKHFSDPDNDKLSYTATSSKPNVVGVSVSGSTVTYTGKAVGSATVSVTAEDPDSLSASQSFEVTVPDEAPVFNPPSYSVELLNTASMGTEVVTVSAKDPEGKAVTYSLSGLGSDKFAIDEDSGEITVSGTLTVGEYQLTAMAKDPAGNKGSAPVTVEVDPDDPPVFDPLSYSVSIKVDATSVVTVSAKDPEGEAVKYSLSGSDKFVIDEDSGEITVAGTLSVTTYNLTATATDPPGNAGTAPVTVKVVNNPPDVTATASPNPVEEGGTVHLKGTAVDPEGDDMQYLWTQVSGRPNVTIKSATTLSASFTAPSVPNDTDLTFRLMATDERGATGSADTTVTVEPPPNEPPDTVGTIPDDTIEVGESGSVDASGYFSDPDGDPLTYTVKSSNANRVSVSVQGSEVTYTGESVGSATVTITADDGRGGTAEQKFRVTVEPANRPPAPKDAIPDQQVQLGTTGRVDVSDYFSDPDKDPLTYEASTAASAVARVSVEGSTVRFRGLRLGDATVKVTARDSGGLTATQRFDVEVYPATQPECAITSVGDSTFTVRENATTVGTVRVRASDCGALDYVLAGTGASDVSAAAVSANNDDAAITGRFDFERRSSYDLTLTVSERGGSASKSGRVRITVTDVNEAPRSVGA
ncbi:MAG: cadherin domain-containing protein, partial [Gammaproteobacteria bacterium]|nr:cadherin domain-containing protein [Gammaproteobacteria bacterium]MDE0258253.1 cadherin domain-containing protein [Gammaproteobacteria bacterium]